MSTTTKGLPNACPTCLVAAGQPCVSYKGVPTNAHHPRVRGEWPVLDQCVMPPRGVERVGERCRYCGHTSLVHPQAFANPALTECAICALHRTIRELTPET